MEHRAVLGRHVAGVENVLDPDRYAMKSAERSFARLQAIGFMGLVQRIGGIEKSPCANRILKLLDPGNTLLNQFDGRQCRPTGSRPPPRTR